MKRDQVIRLLREEAKALGWSLEIDMKSGKGSHYRIEVNGRKSIIKSGELSPLYIEIIRRQLGLR
jgi:hypothetical protein